MLLRALTDDNWLSQSMPPDLGRPRKLSCAHVEGEGIKKAEHAAATDVRPIAKLAITAGEQPKPCDGLSCR